MNLFRCSVFVAVGFCLVGALPAFGATYSSVIDAANPVAYWRLGETSGSTASNSVNPGTHDGAISSGVTLGVPGGLYSDTADTAFRYDATTDTVTVPYNAALNTTSFSVEFWARPTGREDEWRGPVFNRTNDATGGYGFNFYVSDNLNTAIDNNWSFWVGRDKASAGSGGDWRNVYDTTGGVANQVTLGQWYYITGTYDETTDEMKLYVDGALVATAMEPYFRPKPSGSLSIGLPSGSLSFPGDLDEVAVYNRALGDDEIAFHYEVGVAPEPSTLVLLVSAILGLAVLARRRRRT